MSRVFTEVEVNDFFFFIEDKTSATLVESVPLKSLSVWMAAGERDAFRGLLH